MLAEQRKERLSIPHELLDNGDQSGFTLIEIIAVLVILGILITFAVPKYFGLMKEARIKAAQYSISEIKSRAKCSYARLLIQRDGTQPTITEVTANTDNNVGSDFTITLTELGNNIIISVIQVKGSNEDMPVNDTWTLPTQN